MSDDDSNNRFAYDASLPAAILFTVLFGLSMLTHIWQAWTSRTLFMLTIIVATAMQVVGYVFRSITIQDENSFVLWIVSQILIVVSPAVLAAQVYMIVGRMMSYVGPESTFMSHTIITKLFVGVDVISFVTQSGGSALLFQDDPLAHVKQLKLGRAILIAGFVFQMAAFFIFFLTTILFHRKSIQLKGEKLLPLRPLFWAFYTVSTLIIIRSIYRTIEFVEFDFSTGAGYLYNHEWPYYVLDTVLIFLATITLNVWHPSRYLPRKKGQRMDGSVEEARKHWWSRAPPSAAPSELTLTNRGTPTV